MKIQFFADFLIDKSRGKITQNIINNAYYKLESFAKGYQGLGDLLVKEKIITKEELKIYINEFESLHSRNNADGNDFIK